MIIIIIIIIRPDDLHGREARLPQRGVHDHPLRRAVRRGHGGAHAVLNHHNNNISIIIITIIMITIILILLLIKTITAIITTNIVIIMIIIIIIIIIVILIVVVSWFTATPRSLALALPCAAPRSSAYMISIFMLD